MLMGQVGGPREGSGHQAWDEGWETVVGSRSWG